MNNDPSVKFMQRALDLAVLAEGNTSPNPMVGSVIVHNNRIIGEGYHIMAGEAHAEVKAIEAVKEKDLLRESTIYVNLEPCSHYGRTPPCAKRIIEEGIPKVVIGALDPSDKISGNGLKMLRDAGVKVSTGVLEEESIRVNRRFFTFHKKNRPYIILKWAQSNDGFLDRLRNTYEIGPNWITGKEERILVHKWRSQEDAILIGDKTACNDNPGLDVRYWKGNNPRRYVLSESDDLPAGLKIFKGEPATVIFTTENPRNPQNADYKTLSSRDMAISEVLEHMYNNDIQSVIIEGGCTVLSQFIESGFWDEARIFKGNVLFENGLQAPLIQGRIVKKQQFPSSTLEYWLPG